METFDRVALKLFRTSTKYSCFLNCSTKLIRTLKIRDPFVLVFMDTYTHTTKIDLIKDMLYIN